MADLVTQFDLTSYVPAEAQASISTGVAYYNQIKAAAQTITVGPHGSIQISDAGAQAVEGAVIAGVSALVPEIGVFYLAFQLLMAVLPNAGAGPGVCATDPPLGSAPSQLTAWPHFNSWAASFGPYINPPNSFEAFANPALEYNWLLFANCYSTSPGYVPPPALLATLASSWNTVHSPSSTRTITHTGLNQQWGTPPDYDPIANAMELDVIQKSMPPGNLTFDQTVTATGNAPRNVTSSITINNGPNMSLVDQIQAEMQAVKAVEAKNSASASSPAKTAVGVTAATAGAVTLTAIVWSLATGKAWDWAFSQAWAEIKEMAGAREAREAREARSRRRRRR